MKRSFAVFAASATLAGTAINVAADAANCPAYMSGEAAFEKRMTSVWQAQKAARTTFHSKTKIAKERWANARKAAIDTHGLAWTNAWRNRRQAEQRIGDRFYRAKFAASEAYDKARRQADAKLLQTAIRLDLALSTDGGNAPAEVALKRKKQEAEALRDKVVESAARTRDQALKAAQDERDRATAAEEATLDGVLKAARNARDEAFRVASEAYSKAWKSAEAARDGAMEKYGERSEDALKTLGDDYMEAYRNPGAGPRRTVSGYDRAIVLKLAVHEREQHCPQLLTRQVVPR